MAIISHGLGVMVFNATFNNISVISWRPVLFIDDRNRSLEKTTALLQVTVKLYIKECCIEYTWLEQGFELTTSEVIGTDSVKTKYCRTSPVK